MRYEIELKGCESTIHCYRDNSELALVDIKIINVLAGRWVPWKISEIWESPKLSMEVSRICEIASGYITRSSIIALMMEIQAVVQSVYPDESDFKDDVDIYHKLFDRDRTVPVNNTLAAFTYDGLDIVSQDIEIHDSDDSSAGNLIKVVSIRPAAPTMFDCAVSYIVSDKGDHYELIQFLGVVGSFNKDPDRYVENAKRHQFGKAGCDLIDRKVEKAIIDNMPYLPDDCKESIKDIIVSKKIPK